MSGLHPDLALVWYLLLAFVLLLAFLLDGFGLGVGVISLFAGREKDRGVMLASVGRIWHANQTWLVVLGAILFGAFPLVYAVVLSSMYLPVALMLLGLIFRGVSLEYYQHAEHKARWGLAFGLGSLAAALGEGLILGGVLGGLPLHGTRFLGGPWHWLSAFGLLTALTALAAFGLTGACWLVLKTTGDLREKCLRAARAAAFLLLLTGSALVIWTLGRYPALTAQWSAWPGLVWGALPLALAGATFLCLVISLSQQRGGLSFLLSLGLVIFCLAGLLGSWFPVLLPPGLTIFAAAAGAANLEVMLVGLGLLLPIMLVYNAYQYWVFRGKADEGY